MASWLEHSGKLSNPIIEGLNPVCSTCESLLVRDGPEMSHMHSGCLVTQQWLSVNHRGYYYISSVLAMTPCASTSIALREK